MINKSITDLIKLSLWGSGSTSADQDTYEEMKRHAIAALPAPFLDSLGLSPDLKNEWMLLIIRQISYYTQYNYVQSNLPISVPYVILKGTSSAKYYHYPEYRVVGDIDIMTRREDFDIACSQLVDNGYSIVNDIYKETNLKKNGISIDLHRQFASLNDLDYVKYFDDLIIENINPSHVLPDVVNGLVILEHINQHLEGGIGLRQIIDWMMFVDKCLPDDEWPEFREMAKKIGLEKLAIVCTQMCEMYLGLSHREWCAEADTALCERLMEYVMECGNFGSKRTSDVFISENVFSYISSPRDFFKLLQKQGLISVCSTR